MEVKNSKLCDTCASLHLTRSHFEPWGPRIDAWYNRYNNHELFKIAHYTTGYLRLNESQCLLCHLLLHVLRKDYSSYPKLLNWDTVWRLSWGRNTYEYDTVDRTLFSPGLSLFAPGHNEICQTTLQLIRQPGAECLLAGRQVSSRLDLERIRRWLSRCRESHGPLCRQTYLDIPLHPWNASGFVVIDLERMCLKELTEEADYIALSYVWGDSNHPVTVSSNVQEFKKDGAFIRVKLAKTIQDAIDIAKHLGFRYFWVDALCIVQDDIAVKSHLIAHMAAIYGHATLTIIAASSDHADAGIPGWATGGNCSPRVVTKRLTDNFTLGLSSVLGNRLGRLPYVKRGWTYQEGVLSPRCLIFLDQLAFFNCRSATWQEDIMAESDAVNKFASPHSLGRITSTVLAAGPLAVFSEHVRTYSGRSLTYEHDKWNAFSGIESSLGRIMNHTRMWYGMPAAVFDWVVLWREWSTYSDNRSNCGSFPTWSWLSLRSSIQFPDDTKSQQVQSWLRDWTWIEWFIAEEEGKIVPVWSPSVATNVGITRKHTDGQDTTEHFMPEYTPRIQTSSAPHRRGPLRGTLEVPPRRNGKARQKLWNLAILRAKKKIDRETCPIRKGSLLFYTWVAVYERGDPTHPINRYAPEANVEPNGVPLMDRQNQICGFIWKNPEAKMQKGLVDLLILSFAGPGMTNLTNGRFDYIGFDLAPQYLPITRHEDSLDGEEFCIAFPSAENLPSATLKRWHEWEYLNVMLVSTLTTKATTRYIRVGIGILHKRALKYAYSLDWKQVILE